MMRLVSWMALFLVAAASAAWSAEPDQPAIATQQVQATDVEALVAESLTEQGAAEKLSATLTGRSNTTLYRGAGPLSIALTALDFNARNFTFSGSLDIYDGEKLAQTLHITGRYDALVDVPVLTQRLHSGDIIEATDIEWIAMPEHRLRKDTILSEDILIGQTPRRLISEQRPIRATDIEKPRAVKKGDSIQLSFRTPSMEIRALGEAMEDGAAGDTIRVRNTDSQLMVLAIITAKGTAEVSPSTQLSLNQ